MFDNSQNATHLQHLEEPIHVAIPGSLYSYHFQLTGDNLDQLEVKIIGGGDWLSLEQKANGECTISGTPDDKDVQQLELLIVITDPNVFGEPETFAYELEVKPRDVDLQQSSAVTVAEAEIGGGSRGEQAQAIAGGAPVVVSMESIASLSVAKNKDRSRYE